MDKSLHKQILHNLIYTHIQLECLWKACLLFCSISTLILFTNAKIINILSLPVEILVYIISFLPMARDVVKLQYVKNITSCEQNPITMEWIYLATVWSSRRTFHHERIEGLWSVHKTIDLFHHWESQWCYLSVVTLHN